MVTDYNKEPEKIEKKGKLTKVRDLNNKSIVFTWHDLSIKILIDYDIDSFYLYIHA